MKGGADSKVVCETAMAAARHKQKNKRKPKNKDLNELQPPSPRPKQPALACSNSVLGCLGTTMSMKTYSMAPLSPDYSSRIRTASSRGHSGPIISLVPKEAREEIRKGGGFESHEPTSPKVSCIGQVNLKTKMARKAKDQSSNNNTVRSALQTKETRDELGKMSKLRRFFSGKNLHEKPVSGEPREAATEAEGNNIPSLAQMKRFASGREYAAIANAFRDSEDFVYESDESDASDEDGEEIHVNVSPMVDLPELRTKSEMNGASL